MDINLWKENIVEIIQEIADRNKQEISWPLGSDDISSPTEMYCLLLDDFMFEEFLSISRNGLNSRQIDLGQQLITKLYEYSPQGTTLPNEESMLKDPKWDDVRRSASEFVKSLQ